MSDYYSVLGVSEDAEISVIRRKYYKLAKQYHPDACPNDKAAEERFKAISEAWEVLSNPQKRAGYDQQRQKKQQQVHTKAKKNVTPMGGNVDVENLMSYFDSFFGKVTTPSGGKKAANPLDGTDFFEKFMGIKEK